MNAAQKKAAKVAAEVAAAKGETPATAGSTDKKVPQTEAHQGNGDAPAAFETGRAEPSNDDLANAAEAALSSTPSRQMPSPMRQLTDAEKTDRAENIARLQEEVLMLDLETKRVLLEQTMETTATYKQTKAQRLKAAESAQKLLEQGEWTRLQTEAGCDHMTGGFGMEDIYQGNSVPSVVMMDLPVPGRKILLCYRCLKVTMTPDPHLRLTDLDLYLRQMIDYKEFLKLERKSLSRAMSGPIFKFEKDGLPLDPVIV